MPISKGTKTNTQGSESLKNKNDCVGAMNTSSKKQNFKKVPTGNRLNPETDLVVKKANSMPADS